MFEEEPISWPFRVLDADGNVLFRDALTFANATVFRNTSQAEREAIQQAQYQAHLDAIQYAQDHPEESTPPEEG